MTAAVDIKPRGTEDAVPARPQWLDEVNTRLATSPHIVLVGAQNEEHLSPTNAGATWRSTANMVTRALWDAGYVLVLSWTIEDGVECVLETTPGTFAECWKDAADSRRGLTGGSADSLASVMRVVHRFGATGDADSPVYRAALLIAGAERLAEASGVTPLREIFALAQHQALAAEPRAAGTDRGPLFNAIVWLASQERDLAPWYLQTRGVQVLSVPLPDVTTRRAVATVVLSDFRRSDGLDQEGRVSRVRSLADQCEGMTQAQMHEVGRFAADRGIDVDHVEDAVRGTQSGLARSPWRDPELRTTIQRASQILLGERPPNAGEAVRPVLGQPKAMHKALEAISRSALGLSDWDESQQSARPRGILFFAGPTGVGKTFLAKQLATAIFGRQDAMVRFDMSEYAAEQSEARFIGSPPGYVGYESGGQLTNAVRDRPFSLLLFDEIEKAHPLVLDKFLQILEDGRLTDGSGSTIHFGETLIVFTSNIGVIERPRPGSIERRVLLRPPDPYAKVEEVVRKAIQVYFREELGRPEILNRLGDNVVVFGFLEAPIAQQMLREMVGTVCAAVRDRQGIDLVVSAQSMAHLEEAVVKPDNLQHGGRGVKNVVESLLVNPVSWYLMTSERGSSLEVRGITDAGLDVVRRG